MLNNKYGKSALALTLSGFMTVAAAAVYIDDEGVGFVGKGDVQLALDWNNKSLQECVGSTDTFTNSEAGCLEFRVASKTVTETTWTCDRDAGHQTQERLNTTTTVFQGVVSSLARVKQQVTGFNLNGFVDGEPTTVTETDGPAVGSCPTGWTAIDLQTTKTGGDDDKLEVKAYDGEWVVLPITPTL